MYIEVTVLSNYFEIQAQLYWSYQTVSDLIRGAYLLVAINYKVYFQEIIISFIILLASHALSCIRMQIYDFFGSIFT